MSRLKISVFLLSILFSLSGAADTARIAVASNFIQPAQALGARFQKLTPHSVAFSFGSTGKLYAQILHGAPFHVFLAADRRRPELLEQDGLAVPNARFSYAFGVLALWSAEPALFTDHSFIDQVSASKRLAMPNPKLAPYGAAARSLLKQLGYEQDLGKALVYGESVGQAFQFVASRNASAGFVALPQVIHWRSLHPNQQDSLWIPDRSLYPAITQQAVLLTRAKNNPAAKAFFDFLKSDSARTIILRYGYALDARENATENAIDNNETMAHNHHRLED